MALMHVPVVVKVPNRPETGCYELADGSLREYPFGVAQIEFMGEVTGGRVIFGPENIGRHHD